MSNWMKKLEENNMMIETHDGIEIIHGENDYGGVICGSTNYIEGLGHEETPAKDRGIHNTLKTDCNSGGEIRVTKDNIAVYVCEDHIEEAVQYFRWLNDWKSVTWTRKIKEKGN